MKKLYIIGAGMGKDCLISPYASKIIRKNNKIYITKGMENRFNLNCDCLSLKEIYSELENNQGHEDCVLLVSGDAGFYSLSKGIIHTFGNCYDIEIVNGFNSMQYFCGKLKKSYENLKTVSMHGRDGNIISHVTYSNEVFVLTGGDFKVQDICRLFCEKNMDSRLKIYIGENLSAESEKIYEGKPSDFTDGDFSSLSVMLVENREPADRYSAIKDEEFIRAKVPMTKFEIRSVVLSRMNIRPDDIVYDIGAGTGSVTIEMAKRAFEGKVYAFEKNLEAVTLIQENMNKFGVYNIDIFAGDAKEQIGQAPCPNKVFVGGSSGDMGELLEMIEKMNPKAEIVFTANTLQAISQITALDIEIESVTQISTARNKKAGAYDLMIGQNPVYVVRGNFKGR